MRPSQAEEWHRSGSWRLRRGLHADRLVVLVEQGNAVVEQDLVDRGLVLLDQTIKLTLPVLVRAPHTHADAEDELRPGLLLHERRDMKRRVRLPRIKAGHRSPEHAGVDVA